MAFNPDIHRRRSIRLRDFDYSSAGAYSVTICTFERECLFGEVVDGEMQLNEMGTLAVKCWQGIPDHFPHIELHEFVVMPNHFHAILQIAGNVATNVGAKQGVSASPGIDGIGNDGNNQGEASESFASPLPPLPHGTVRGSLGGHAVPRTPTKPQPSKRAQHAVLLRETKPAPAASDDFTSLDSVLAAILERMQPGREYSRADIAEPLGLSTGRWNAAIQELRRMGKVRQMGERRGAKYVRA